MTKDELQQMEHLRDEIEELDNAWWVVFDLDRDDTKEVEEAIQQKATMFRHQLTPLRSKQKQEEWDALTPDQQKKSKMLAEMANQIGNQLERDMIEGKE